MGSGKTTSFDIAHRAGVSQATVSRALRNSPLVNPETRERIQKIARELNYHVDRRAASLRSQQSNTIALLIFEDPTSDDSQINPFFLSMLGNVAREAAQHDYDVLVSFQQLSADWHDEYELSNRADGIILLGYGDYVSFTDKLAKLLEENAHFMVWGAHAPLGHTVGCDNVEGGLIATRHLLECGRRRIAFLGGTGAGSPEMQERFQGYRQALQEAGLDVDTRLQLDADNQEQSGFESIQKLLDSGIEFDAVFCASDLIAVGAIRYMRKNGISVPDDVSVVGFDDIPAASYLSPALTTIRQDTKQAAQVLVNKTLRLIRGEAVESRRLAPSLVIRGSCGGRRN